MDISGLIQTLNNAADAPGVELKEEDRLACLAACTRLQEKLENPLEACHRFVFGVCQGIGLRLGIQMRLFEKTVASGAPFTVEGLATDLSADPDLIRRVMRLLAGMKLYEELGKDCYVAKPLAAAFVPPSPISLVVRQVGPTMPVVASLPEYFAEKGYTSPADAFNGPWQYAYHTDDHYFDWYAKRPELQQVFNDVMKFSRMGRGEQWFEFYPVEEKLNIQSPTGTVLVDIGGGLGHDLIEFKNHFPDLQGKLILEDLPSVVAEVKDLPHGIQALGHDFFEPQPSSLKDAKAYYLRTVLHDWPDKQARAILEHIRDVMSKDSVLLINENSIPDRNVSLYGAYCDLLMMACFSSLDRTEQQFATLLDDAGFRLLKVWRPKVVLPGSAVLFEAVIKG